MSEVLGMRPEILLWQDGYIQTPGTAPVTNIHKQNKTKQTMIGIQTM